MSVTGIATEEDSLIDRVFLCYALTDWIVGVPFHVVPLDEIRLQDPLCRSLHVFLRSLSPRIDILVVGALKLDIQSDEVVLPGYDHDRAMVTVDGTFDLPQISHNSYLSISLK